MIGQNSLRKMFTKSCSDLGIKHPPGITGDFMRGGSFEELAIEMSSFEERRDSDLKEERYMR